MTKLSGWLHYSKVVHLKSKISQMRSKLDNWGGGGGAHIHIFMFCAINFF